MNDEHDDLPGVAGAVADRTPVDWEAEIRRLARVRHDNVVVVHGADRHDGRLGLWTDLVDGRTLEELLNERGPFGAEEASLIGIDLCRALSAVHAAGLVHQDVKTANVMRRSGGRIVLMDFSAVREHYEMTGLAADEPVSGTPLFMAPETFLGGRPGPEADIYSLGVLLYRLVSGRCPTEGKTLDELLQRHERGESTPLRDRRPDLPTAFVNVVERALEREPTRRYASAGEFERALTRTLGSRTGNRDDRSRPWWSGWPVPVAAALVFVAVVTLLLRPPST